MTGQVNSLRSRAEAADAEIGRLTTAHRQATERAEQASRAFTSTESKVAGLDAGELGLDVEHEAAVDVLTGLDAELAVLRREELAAAQTRAALAARVEALHVGLQRQDASAALLAATDQVSGLLGSVAALISVEPGYETAVATAFGSAADAVAVAGLDAALQAFDHLKAEDLGRAGMLLGAPEIEGGPEGLAETWPELPGSARYAVDVVDVPPELRAAVRRVLRKVALVEDLDAAHRLVAAVPEIVAVTRDGDVLSTHFASGGSSTQPTLIEVQAAIDDAETRLAEANHACERLRFAQSELEDRQRSASQTVEVTLARLHESDASMAALAEELAQLSAAARSAHGEAERLLAAVAQAEQARDADLSGLADLEHRLELASDERRRGRARSGRARPARP